MLDQLMGFVSTHLALTTLLMPWKQIVTTTIATGKQEEVIDIYIWDMLRQENWFYKMSTDATPVPVSDDSLCNMVMVMFIMAVVSIILTIITYGIRTFFPTVDSNVSSVVDFASWVTLVSLFFCFMLSQADFDASWAFGYRAGLGLPVTADTEKMFLPIGIVVLHLIMLSYYVGYDIKDRLKKN